jgi:hypothetical protein
MNVKELLKVWEEGIVAATVPALKRREEVSEADLADHMNVLHIRTRLQTGRGLFNTPPVSPISWGNGYSGPLEVTAYCQSARIC